MLRNMRECTEKCADKPYYEDVNDFVEKFEQLCREHGEERVTKAHARKMVQNETVDPEWLGCYTIGMIIGVYESKQPEPFKDVKHKFEEHFKKYEAPSILPSESGDQAVDPGGVQGTSESEQEETSASASAFGFGNTATSGEETSSLSTSCEGNTTTPLSSLTATSLPGITKAGAGGDEGSAEGGAV